MHCSGARSGGHLSLQMVASDADVYDLGLMPVCAPRAENLHVLQCSARPLRHEQFHA